ncbi:hypothetical protein M193_gp092 [Halorubrum tailed phage 7]|uniref:hypothetical protein n=1 Tax=Halorubrum tailed phage 7 TaxID=2847108 RepID=UPI0003348A0C|nr:hypothetical protein M193_gp092 [Halorubrum tailed phage 7]AGM10953.1 hypothetical protein HRTV7_82 [Halorubrum tailed phage 7]UBF22231.1 Zn finger [Halorubrum virus HRTV-2]
MNECDFCGGPRINGLPIRRDPRTGGWTRANGVNPSSKFACRSCAKDRLETTAEG